MTVGTMLDFLIRAATQPLRDAIDVLDGLSEGELRTKAIARLGADVVGGMALSEIVEAMTDVET